MPQAHKCQKCGRFFKEREHFDQHKCQPKEFSAELVDLTDREYCQKFGHPGCYWADGVLTLPGKGEEVSGTREKFSEPGAVGGYSGGGYDSNGWTGYKAWVIRKCDRCGEEVRTWEQVWD